jgi:hypothetical protein
MPEEMGTEFLGSSLKFFKALPILELHAGIQDRECSDEN